MKRDRNRALSGGVDDQDTINSRERERDRSNTSSIERALEKKKDAHKRQKTSNITDGASSFILTSSKVSAGPSQRIME